MRAGIILFAHGSRDPEWADPFERLARKLRTLRPGVMVRNAYLENMHPTLEEAVASLAGEDVREIVITPAFLAPGGHIKTDLPRLVEGLQARYPAIGLRVLPTIGEADAALDAIAAWIATAASS